MTQRIDYNPRIAWAECFEDGLRTQAAADMQEAGCKVQTSGLKQSGGSHNDHYTPIYSTVMGMKETDPDSFAVGNWLSLNDEGSANRYLDDVAEVVLEQFIDRIGAEAWGEYRPARRERVEALVQARMVMERNNVDGTRPAWTPKDIGYYCREHIGVKISEPNWKRDWEWAWAILGRIMDDLEHEAMEPVVDSISRANKLIWAERQEAA